MIKINLLKKKGGVQPPESTQTFSQTVFDMSSAGSRGAASSSVGVLLKILVLVAGPIGLFLFEKDNIDKLNRQNTTIQTELATVEAQVNALQMVSDVLKKYTDERDQAQKLLDRVQKLMATRLRESHFLSLLPDALPRDAWLASVKVQTGNVSLVAISSRGDALTEFSGSLERHKSLRDVLTKSTTDEKTGSGSFKKAEIDLKLGEM